MGTSCATHTFQIVRMALRRELLLAVSRVWDANKQAVRLTAISEILRDERCFDALVRERAERVRVGPDPEGLMRDALSPKRDKVLALTRKYMQNGECASVLADLRSIRHERLAHRQVEPARVEHKQATDEQVEELYQDTLAIVTHLPRWCWPPPSILPTKPPRCTEITLVSSGRRLGERGQRGTRTTGRPGECHMPICSVVMSCTTDGFACVIASMSTW
ncbi:hypothetical protein PCO31110_04024 [Pandoraea communis]|uniref:HEPN AbiU2-like domain-containing protein n=1 Tax=Pandoraea communis TaxID=2508297 RepID=A0A5E4XMT7_9BURK|nr:hypothetical protein PCO31110_04024 [Pandoraea communis]